MDTLRDVVIGSRESAVAEAGQRAMDRHEMLSVWKVAGRAFQILPIKDRAPFRTALWIADVFPRAAGRRTP